MPLQATSGAASYDGFGGGAAAVPNYIEDVFSTYLYTGGTTTQTITNGIDLSTKGGMVWIKSRASTYNHSIWDSSRAGKYLFANTTDAQTSTAYVNFLTTGFTVAAQDGFGYESPYGGPYVSWTFRKQPKFFDVVTYTGNSTAGRTIPHNLGSVPGCIIVKRTSSAQDWGVWHRSLAAGNLLYLNLTSAAGSNPDVFTTTQPTSSVFSVGNDAVTNTSGQTYVAYLFAHDAGGFGLTGTDNVISCGSFSGASLVTLGYEPQWVLIRRIDTAADWRIFDTMRGFNVSSGGALLSPNRSDAETVGSDIRPSATGFTPTSFPSGTYIYIAIRRGPMKVPTLGTSVFSPVARTGTGSTANVSAGFPVDTAWIDNRTNTSFQGFVFFDRLRGQSIRLSPAYTDSEQSTPTNELTSFASNTQVTLGASTSDRYTNYSGYTYINYFMQRAPSFFDEVCYAGSGSSPQVLTHNLTVTPEMMIVKFRDGSTNWYVYHSTLGNTKAVYLDQTSNPVTSAVFWNNTSPTSTQFTVGSFPSGAGNYVAYLFATLAGVSKVGSYTGNGTTQTIDCGFTGGARFVLIRRTDSTGDWYVWDSARGIVAGNDPHLSLNTTAAEVTTDDSVDTDSAGFVVNQVSATNVNVSSATYIFLAIA